MVAIPRSANAFAGMLCSLIPGLCTQSGDDCGLSSVTIPLSSDQQTALGLPAAPLSAIGVGFGVQNYTCSTDNVFVSTGAVGEVFDISDLVSGNNSVVYTIHNDLFNFWNSPQAGDATVQELIDELPCADPPTPVNNQHYFIDDGAGGISPVWDFRASPEFEGVDDAVIVAKVLANTPDANPAENVSWLHLGKVSGDIADEVYRIFTAGGVPPTSCVSGTTQDISIKYTSQYWYFGGSLGLGSHQW